MSYILEALRKVERERRQPQIPSINIEHRNEQPSRYRWILWLLVLLVLVNLAWFAYNTMTQQSKPDDAIPTKQRNAIELSKTSPDQTIAQLKRDQSTDHQIQQVKTGIGPKKPAKSPQSIADLVANTKQHQQRKQQKKQAVTTPIKRSLSIDQPRLKKPVTKQNAKVTKPRQAKLNTAPTRTAIKPPASKPRLKRNTLTKKTRQKPAPTIKKPRAQVEKKSAKAKKIPMLGQMSSEFRAQIPPLDINVYVHEDNPDYAFVIINMRKYRIGDRINNDIKLVNIGADSLVLNKNGQQFQVARP